jgi:G3E family GTPase
VVIETTGLADPGPVAQTFFMDDEIAESYLLDSILTLVDAKHADQQLDTRRKPAPDRLRRPDLHQQDRPGRRPDRRGADPPCQAHEPARAADESELRLRAAGVGVRPQGFNLNAKLDIDPDFLKADEHDHDPWA